MIAGMSRSAAAIAAFGGRLQGAESGGGTGATTMSLAQGGAHVGRDGPGLPEGLATHIATALRRVSGLEIDLVGARSVERAVGERIQALVANGDISDAWAYPGRVEQNVDERQWLIEAAVVPETWFFRHRESFDFLAVQARQRYYGGGMAGTTSAGTNAPLRIASVPCSTGEEPYSIAMTLLLDGLPPNAFLIDAMDISAVALSQAETGLYRPNAFRGCPDSLRDRFFTARSLPVGSSAMHETVWDIHRDARACVSFRRANLVADTRIGADTGQGGTYDFIFCRNVLIYFDRPTQTAVIEKLRAALRPGGFLLVGPAEAALVSRVGLTAAAAPLAFAFHRDRPMSAEPARAPMPLPRVPSQGASPFAASAAAARGTPVVSRPGVAAPRPGGPATVAGRGSAASWPPTSTPAASLASSAGGAASASGRGSALRPSVGATALRAPVQGKGVSAVAEQRDPVALAYAEAERLANLGDIAQATQRCQALVAEGKAGADVYCLMGVLADASGRSAEAREHFRRALYLEANHAGALVQYAEHLALEGDDAGAQRLMARARRAHPDLF